MTTTVHTLASGPLEVQLMELGASLHRLVLHDSRGPTDVALGHRTGQEYLDARDFMGATVGRLANRVGGGRVPVGDRVFHVPVDDGPNALHGGPDGFDLRTWETVDVTDASVTFRLESPDGDQGLPGTLEVLVTYALQGMSLSCSTEVRTDAPTWVSLTNHSFFNLEGEGSGTVDAHELSVAADHVTENDADLLPTGALLPVEGTSLDLREARRLGDVVRSTHPSVVTARGLDHNYVLSGSGLRPVARLSAPSVGRTLTLHSDRPGLQVYTGNFLDGSTVGHGGRLYRQGAGVALEPQHFPDTPNQPSFPSCLVQPGEPQVSTLVWELFSES